MTILPGQNTLTYAPGRTNDQAGGYLSQLLEYVRQGPSGAGSSTVVVTGATITVTQYANIVDTTTGTDTVPANLDFITAPDLPPGFEILVRIASASRRITFRHARGGNNQIMLLEEKDWTPVSASSFAVFRKFGTNWTEIWRFWGRDTAGARSFMGLPPNAAFPLASTTQRRAEPPTEAGFAPNVMMTLGDTAEMLYPRESPEYEIVLSGSGSWTHGFDTVPRRVDAVLRNKVSDQGWGPGREIPVGCLYDYPPLVAANALTVNYSFGPSRPQLYPNAGGAPVNIVGANWRLVIRASRW